jgi:hypothetical protein
MCQILSVLLGGRPRWRDSDIARRWDHQFHRAPLKLYMTSKPDILFLSLVVAKKSYIKRDIFVRDGLKGRGQDFRYRENRFGMNCTLFDVCPSPISVIDGEGLEDSEWLGGPMLKRRQCLVNSLGYD